MDTVAEALASEADAFVARLPSDDADARYLREEIRVAIDALRLGGDFAGTDDRWGAWVFARIVVETAIRLAWPTATKSSRPEPEFVRQRLRRVEKRDFQYLLAASDFAREVLASPIFADADRVRADLEAIGPAAPDLRIMAEEVGLEGVYLLHKLCSAAAHPGLGTRARIAEVYPADEVLLLLRWSFSAAVVGLNGIADVLFATDSTLVKKNLVFFFTTSDRLLPPRGEPV